MDTVTFSHSVLRMFVTQYQVTNSSQVSTEHILEGPEQAWVYRGRTQHTTALELYDQGRTQHTTAWNSMTRMHSATPHVRTLELHAACLEVTTKDSEPDGLTNGKDKSPQRAKPSLAFLGMESH